MVMTQVNHHIEIEMKLKKELASHSERVSALEAELVEEARLNGMGSEREARLMAENDRLREALTEIVAIENKVTGGDWDEIAQARLIARAALGADSRQVYDGRTEETNRCLNQPCENHAEFRCEQPQRVNEAANDYADRKIPRLTLKKHWHCDPDFHAMVAAFEAGAKWALSQQANEPNNCTDEPELRNRLEQAQHECAGPEVVHKYEGSGVGAPCGANGEDDAFHPFWNSVTCKACLKTVETESITSGGNDG